MALLLTNESKEKKYGELREIRDFIRLITKKSNNYNEKYKKIKFNDELPLNKTMEIPTMITVVRAFIKKSNIVL